MPTMIIPSETKLHAGTRSSKDGLPRATYRKDVLRTGTFQNYDWEVEYTRNDLDRFVDRFEQMRSNGLDIEVTVDHSWSARDVIGYVWKMWVEDTKLWAEFEIIGQDNIDLVERVRNVSIEVLENFKDSEAREYGRVIRAVSVVQSPVVSGQEAFELIASHRKGEDIRILHHSTQPRKNKGEDQNMDIAKLLSIVGSTLGLKDLTADNAETKLKEFGAKATEAMKVDPKDLEAKLHSAETDRDQWKAKYEAAAAAKPEGVQLYSKLPQERRETIDDAADLVSGQLSDLKGKTLLVTDDVIKTLSNALLGPAGERNVIMLSRNKDGGDRPAQAVVKTLKSAVQADITKSRPAAKTGGEDKNDGIDQASIDIAKNFSSVKG